MGHWNNLNDSKRFDMKQINMIIIKITEKKKRKYEQRKILEFFFFWFLKIFPCICQQKRTTVVLVKVLIAALYEWELSSYKCLVLFYILLNKWVCPRGFVDILNCRTKNFIIHLEWVCVRQKKPSIDSRENSIGIVWWQW